ncbi:hypothetical protein ACET3X_001845 [Alternaria dauci]|uniref:Uncharacterized protein n=1 Tax=Alternaria dauci TaxID=48095 RepID=A0ABR3UYI1_9PLEO
MTPEAPSLIEECTNGTTKAGLYLSRLGLEKNFKDPNKPGKPNFKSVPEINKLWLATQQKANEIAKLYPSRKAIREALRRRDICLDDIARDCLETYGHKIWTNGREAPSVLSLDTTTTPSKIKGHAQVAEDKYLRHLIYEHPGDERKIRLLVSAWIIQRACRKAEDDRREGKTSRKEVAKSSTDFSGFIDAVRVKPTKRNSGTWSSSNSSSSFDELNIYEARVRPAVGSRNAANVDNARRTQPQTSRKTRDVQYTSVKRRKKMAVAVVIPARKPRPAAPTEISSRTHTGSELLGKRKTVPRSTQSKEKGLAREALHSTTPLRTTSHRTRTATRGQRVVQSSADKNMESLVAQLKDDRDDLSIELQDLLSTQNPGCHNLADIKRTIGLIDTIALNDAQGLQKTFGDSYDKHKIALDRWLGCIKTLVEFREITGLTGDEDSIKASFPKLLLDVKNEARPLRQRKRQEIVKWFKKPASGELEFTMAGFSEDVASILLEMISRDGFDMKLEELHDIMVPFTTRLIEWFGVVLISSANKN